MASKFGSLSPHWQGGPLKRKCLNCGKEFLCPKGVVKAGNGKYCSRSCTAKSSHRKHRSAPRVECKCIICGTKFIEYKSRMHEKNRGTCCSIECRVEHTKRCISGKNNYRWKGGITKLNQLLRSQMRTRNWSRKVKERDDFTCQECGIRAKKGLGHKVVLNSHHIKSWANHPELRWDINNGITLCENCHGTNRNKGQ